MNGSALALHEIADQADAILEAWYPGEEGGRAVGEILSGQVSPAGRLPVTFYRDVSDLPPFDDYSMEHRTYRYFDGPVLYRFGYGLSYTHFEYGALTLEQGTGVGERRVSTEIRNTGPAGSDEVVEVYVAPPKSPGNPITQLVALRRIHLEKGEQQSVSFDLPDSAFSTVDAQGMRSVLPGRYNVWIGGGQPATGLPGASLQIQIP